MFTTYVYVFRRVPSNGELYKGVKEQSSYIFLIREYEQLYPPDCMIFDPAEEHLQDVQVHKLLSIMSEKDFFPDEKEIEAAEMVAIFIIPTKYTDQIPRVSPGGPYNGFSSLNYF